MEYNQLFGAGLVQNIMSKFASLIGAVSGLAIFRSHSGGSASIDAVSTEPASNSMSLYKKELGGFWDYVAIARLDHSTKHVFIIPGLCFALLLRGARNEEIVLDIVLGFLAAICTASANYAINEWLDRDFDKHHPTKSSRSAVQRELSGRAVFVEWVVLVLAGMIFAGFASKTMLVTVSLLAAQGVLYNVRPMRTKDKQYLDVITESVNNPLRLVIGWAMIDSSSLPPGSIILAYWAGGAFLMAAKRLSEYREIVSSYGKDVLVRYRASFAGYTEVSLTVSCLVYAMFSNFALSVFFIKYHTEYVLLMPLVMLLFAKYMSLSMQPGSTAQKPEKLFREKGLLSIAAALAVVFLIATFVRIPALEVLTQQRYIELK